MTHNTSPSGFFDQLTELEWEVGEVPVGGFLVDSGLWRRTSQSGVGRMAFCRLVELWRRGRGWTLEEMARATDVGLEELVLIEQGTASHPQPRTVFQLAKLMGIPCEKLMELAGLAVPRDPETRLAAVRFAAQSESMDKLSPQEEAALHDLIQVLSDMHRDPPRP